MGFERSCNLLRNLLPRLNQSQLKPKPTAVTGNLLALISSDAPVLVYKKAFYSDARQSEVWSQVSFSTCLIAGSLLCLL